MATYTENFNLRKPTAADNVNVALDIAGNMDLLDAHGHSGTYVPILPTPGSFTYDASGNVLTDPDGNTYTWNADGTPATQTKGGVTRTYTWNADGTLGSVA